MRKEDWTYTFALSDWKASYRFRETNYFLAIFSPTHGCLINHDIISVTIDQMLSDEALTDEDKIALIYYAHIEFDKYRDIAPKHMEELIATIHGCPGEWLAFEGKNKRPNKKAKMPRKKPSQERQELVRI